MLLIHNNIDLSKDVVYNVSSEEYLKIETSQRGVFFLRQFIEEIK